MLAILLPSRLLSLEICRRKLLGFHPRLESIRVSRITRIVRFTRTAASGYPNSPNNRTTPIIRTLFVILKPNRGGDPNTSNIWLYPPSGNRISFGLSLENARTAETHATSNTTERERTRLNNLGGATRRRRRHDRDIDKVDDTPGSALDSWPLPHRSDPLSIDVEHSDRTLPGRRCRLSRSADVAVRVRAVGTFLVSVVLPVVQDLGAHQED